MSFLTLDIVVSGVKEDFTVHDVPYRTQPMEQGKDATVTAENLAVYGIPFRVLRRDGRVLSMSYSTPVEVGAQVAGLFFLGMVTQARSGECGWSGERFYGYQRKLYLGDVIGRIDVLYEGNLMDGIPLIFGVNVWNYETFSPVQPHEKPVFPIKAPYREPFDSDEQASDLFRKSLVLRENEAGEKYTKYVFAFRTRERRLERISVHPWGARDAGIGVSAITSFTPDTPIPAESEWRFTDQQFYVQKGYFPAVDRLARRLYQYRDELPEHFPPDKPAGYRGPHIELKGTPEAELLTNVYYHNIHDMMTNKVEESGQLHTSTRHYPCYGFYEGIGTYRQAGQYNYYEQIWSRDLGRLLCEIVEHGEHDRCVKAADFLFHYLYDPSPLYKRPHWKRIVNASELGIFPENYDGIPFQEFVKGRENDGHASVMLMIYRLYHHRCVDLDYLRAHLPQLTDAAEWFCWQMDCPEESDFDQVLCSESEASYGECGGYDLFSNSYAYFALLAFSSLARDLGEIDLARRWGAYAKRLWAGIEKVFVTTHPRYGRVLCEPESDNWPSELKRMASLLLLPELLGYDPAEDAPQWVELWTNTLKAQRESFFSPMVGGSMGYGQGYTTQTVLLMDEVEDFTQCLNWAARFSYHHTEYPYIVPEGVTYHPSGRFWYRHTDLGNAVQQTEIVKCIRLVLGLDDLNHRAGLRLIPRLPDGWEELDVRRYPAVTLSEGTISRVYVNFHYRRIPDGFAVSFESEKPVKIASIRVGPFPLETRGVAAEGVQDNVTVNSEWRIANGEGTDGAVEGAQGNVTLKRRGSRLFAYIALDRDIQALEFQAVTR